MRFLKTTSFYTITILIAYTYSQLISANIDIDTDNIEACGSSSNYNISLKIPQSAPSSLFLEIFTMSLKFPFDFEILNSDLVLKWEDEEIEFRVGDDNKTIIVDDVEIRNGKYEYRIEIINTGGAVQASFVQQMVKFDLKLISGTWQIRGYNSLNLKGSEGLGLQAYLENDKVDEISCVELDLQHRCSKLMKNSRIFLVTPQYFSSGSSSRNLFSELKTSQCEIAINVRNDYFNFFKGEKTQNVCILSGNRLKIYDNFPVDYSNSDLKLKICGLLVPPSTERICGFQLGFYIDDFQRSPYLQREFCIQAAKPASFSQVGLGKEEFVIKHEFDLDVNLDYHKEVELKDKIFVFKFHELGKENLENKLKVKIGDIEYEEKTLNLNHELIIPTVGLLNTFPIKISVKGIKSPIKPLITNKGIEIQLRTNSGHLSLSGVTNPLKFTFPMIETLKISSTNSKRGQYTELNFELFFKNFEEFEKNLQKNGINFLDTYQLITIVPKEYDISLFIDKDYEIFNLEKREILLKNFRVDFEGNSKLKIKGVFNPVNHIEISPFEFQLRAKTESKETVYKSLKNLNETIQLAKGTIKNLDIGLTYKTENSSDFQLGVEFELDQIPPPASSVVFTIFADLKYIVDFENPCIVMDKMFIHPFCLFKKNILKIENIFENFLDNRGMYSFGINRLKLLGNVEKEIKVKVEIIVNETDSSYYQPVEDYNLFTKCSTNCESCSSSSRSTCASCSSDLDLNPETHQCENKTSNSELKTQKENLKMRFYISTEVRYFSLGLVFASIFCIMIYTNYMNTIYDDSIIENNIAKNLVSWVISYEILLGILIAYYEKKGYMFFIFGVYFSLSFIINLAYASKFLRVSKKCPSVLNCKRSKRCLVKCCYFFAAVFFNSGILFKFIQNAEKMISFMKKPITTCYDIESGSLEKPKKLDEKNRYQVFLYFKSLQSILKLFNMLSIFCTLAAFTWIYLKFHNLSEIYFEFLVLLIFAYFKHRTPIYKEIPLVKSSLERWNFIQQESSRIETRKIKKITEEPKEKNIVDFRPDLETMLEEIKSQMEDALNDNSSRMKKRAGSYNEVDKIQVIPLENYIDSLNKEVDEGLESLSSDEDYDEDSD